jgi:hypothetical protein
MPLVSITDNQRPSRREIQREREREKQREEEPHRTEARVWYYIIINNTYTHTAHGTHHRAEITQRAHTHTHTQAPRTLLGCFRAFSSFVFRFRGAEPVLILQLRVGWCVIQNG